MPAAASSTSKPSDADALSKVVPKGEPARSRPARRGQTAPIRPCSEQKDPVPRSRASHQRGVLFGDPRKPDLTMLNGDGLAGVNRAHGLQGVSDDLAATTLAAADMRLCTSSRISGVLTHVLNPTAAPGRLSSERRLAEATHSCETRILRCGKPFCARVAENRGLESLPPPFEVMRYLPRSAEAGVSHSSLRKKLCDCADRYGQSRYIRDNLGDFGPQGLETRFVGSLLSCFVFERPY